MFRLTYVNGQTHANQRDLVVNGDYVRIKRRDAYNQKVIACRNEFKKRSNVLFQTWPEAFDLSVIRCFCFSSIRSYTENIFS